MDFRKLPSNSEGLLLKLVCSENPTQVLREQYNGLSTQQEQKLDGIIFKKPSIAPFGVILGFLFSSIPRPGGNRGCFGV